MNTQVLNRASILGKANYLFSRQRKNCIEIVEARKSGARCYPRTISTFSYPSMAEQGGSGKSKSPEDLKKDIDQLIGKAQNIVTDMMNPQVQEEVANNLRTAMSLMSQSLEEAGKKVKAGTSAVKENEQLKLMVDRAIIMVDQMKGSEKAVELANTVSNAIKDGSEAASQKLKKCMDEASKELGVKQDQVFKKYKESVKPELDDLMGQANDLAAKIKDPTARKEFLDNVQATATRESIDVVKNVRKLIEDAKRKLI
ncbi:hypothetical protein LSTR_LSTR001293 [Laodelphax striatellus]|uniref:Uncharacterized protein n=1 Tax=Laodelphax striatellus TaxID=195883 RepID=A0A482XAX3_LAOST|nr:hypothetical protein LSTR_LSTR001293 [Laodelphax striatellus]